MNHRLCSSGARRLLSVVGFGIVGAMNAASVQAQPELCGGVDYPFPYTDVASVGAAFCPGIMEAYVTGVSKGTTATTFSPDETVTRVQMTTFLQRSLDTGLTRGNRRSALNQWSIQQFTPGMQTIALKGGALACAADGEYIWAIDNAGDVTQIQASTGFIKARWTGATEATGVMVAAGKVFVTGSTAPGTLYVIDPSKAPGPVTVAAANLGIISNGIAYDGTYIWAANTGDGTVSFAYPQSPPPYIVSVQSGFTSPYGMLYDGAFIWVTDNVAGTLLKLDPTNGAILLTVPVGSAPAYPVFDGTNIWVPNAGSNSLSVVQAVSGKAVATINADASNQLNEPVAAAFDGERVLVTNHGNNTVSVFKAADLSFIANVSTGAASNPQGACSDGINFWVALFGTFNLLRF